VLDQPEVFGATGETWTWRGAIVDPGKPVRIVMAYTDAAGAIGVSPQVSSPNLAVQVNATTYLGNHFFGQWSVIGGSANNHDAVFLPAGASGRPAGTTASFSPNPVTPATAP
jgi:hypothetical protein